MNLQTKAKLPNPKNEYSHANQFVSIGSCFASEIGKRLEDGLFSCLTNPLGTTFNPIALSETLERSINGEQFEKNEFFLHQELWRHFLVHSSLASTNLETSLSNANQALTKLGNSLKQSDLLIVTLGTSIVYQRHDSTATIGHNHKLPLVDFEKRYLSQKEITKAISVSRQTLLKANPSLKICYTVSPVRHTRDGLHENNLSKARLLLAIEDVIENDSSADYFPAYEILLDELRDYRFFAQDLNHPNEQAIEYIWQQFAKTHFSHECLSKIDEIESIKNALSHRPQHPDTKKYLSFKNELADKIENLTKLIPSTVLLKEKWKTLP